MKALAAVPLLSGTPLVGHFLEFRGQRLRLLERAAVELGDLGRADFFGRPVVVVTGAPLLHEVLVEKAGDFVKSRGLSDFGRPLLGNGLLTSEHEVHRRQRKLMSPGFQHGRIARYAEVMAEHGARLVQRWPDAGELDVAREMMQLTLGIVAKTLFDAEVSSEADEIGRALTVANKYVADETGMLLHLPITAPLPRQRAARRAIARLDQTIYRIIAERRRTGADPGDVLSMLLAARDDDGSPMDDRQVRDEAMTVFLAGHETTAAALAWCFDLLGRHPHVAARLRAEVDAALAGRTPTLADLPRLPYTLQVLKETMRLRPPAYITGRIAERDTSIGGHDVPRGMFVILNIYGVHRRADYFADPLVFDPDRFTPEHEKQLPRSAYMPFGGGPRVCIGNHFALMEGQLLLAQIAGAFDLEHVRASETVGEPLITLRPKDGLPMRVRRRVATA